MREIAVISGKGGTGKTSLLLNIIPYFDDLVIADCDVDAPDLHILLAKEIYKTRDFIGFKRPSIDDTLCNQCGICKTMCRFHAINDDYTLKQGACEGCQVCAYVCPNNAITMHDYIIGSLFNRHTNFGELIDARLIPGEESSGKLVSEVRNIAREEAIIQKKDTILIDGSPGIACNVISSITGVDLIVLVTEPSMSGFHDLKRVLTLIKIFSIPVKIVINKYDLSLEKTAEIKEYAALKGIDVILEIPYDNQMLASIQDCVIPSLTQTTFFQSSAWLTFIDTIKKNA